MKEIRTFRTMTADLLALADWLVEAGVLTWRWKAPGSTRLPESCQWWGALSEEGGTEVGLTRKTMRMCC